MRPTSFHIQAISTSTNIDKIRQILFAILFISFLSPPRPCQAWGPCNIM